MEPCNLTSAGAEGDDVYLRSQQRGAPVHHSEFLQKQHCFLQQLHFSDLEEIDTIRKKAFRQFLLPGYRVDKSIKHLPPLTTANVPSASFKTPPEIALLCPEASFCCPKVLSNDVIERDTPQLLSTSSSMVTMEKHTSAHHRNRSYRIVEGPYRKNN